MPFNIDLIYIISPLIVTLISLVVLLYFVKKKRLPFIVLAYSFVAYFGAIALKEIVQIPTYAYLAAHYGASPAILGLYFGIQTVVFEIGLAYLVACVAVSRKSLRMEHAEGYGAGLAFWENGILLGALTFVSLLSTYIIIATGAPATAQATFNILYAAEPMLFSSLSYSSIFVVFLGILERVSSIILHFAWGYLVVVAAVLHKKKYLLMALPMGLVDFFVPYAGSVPLWAFEGLIFVIALMGLAVALTVRKSIAKKKVAKGSKKKNKG